VGNLYALLVEDLTDRVVVLDSWSHVISNQIERFAFLPTGQDTGTIPHFTTRDEIPLKLLIQIR